MHLAQAGLGISFLPTGVLESARELVTRPLIGPRMFRRIGLCYPASKSLKPALSAAIATLGRYQQDRSETAMDAQPNV